MGICSISQRIKMVKLPQPGIESEGNAAVHRGTTDLAMAPAAWISKSCSYKLIMSFVAIQ